MAVLNFRLQGNKLFQKNFSDIPGYSLNTLDTLTVRHWAAHEKPRFFYVGFYCRRILVYAKIHSCIRALLITPVMSTKVNQLSVSSFSSPLQIILATILTVTVW